MFVQWCIKGIIGQDPARGFPDGLDDGEARALIDDRRGILCNWWRKRRKISPAERRAKLVPANLDLHVNNYAVIKDDTPFISLTAGCVERDAFYRTNRVHRADRTALAFATAWGNRPRYLYHLWVIVGLKSAVPVEQVAEERRDLNVYQSWSAFQLEGEVTAKIYIPSVQIKRVERWEPAGFGFVQKVWAHTNPALEEPAVISNVRDLL